MATCISFLQVNTVYIYAVVSNGKREPRQFSLIRSPFAHNANGGLSFVRLLTKKQTEVIHFQTNYTCSVSRWRPQKVDKRMVLEHTHGLFIT